VPQHVGIDGGDLHRCTLLLIVAGFDVAGALYRDWGDV
jgi:hypothetical protein